MSEDKFPLNTIYFYLTEGCNLCCRHCWIAPRYQKENSPYHCLPLELFRSIIKQAKSLGLFQVKLTGGEPLLHPQFQEILEEIRSNDLGLIMETNGLLCTENLARKICACKNAFVSVSLDAVDAQTHEWIRGVSGCFEQALSGIGNLVKVGLKPQIIMTLMRRNKDQIEQMLPLAESLGAGSVKFNLLQPTARGKKMHNAGQTLSIAELVELGQWVENGLSSSTNLPLLFGWPTGFRPLGRMFSNKDYGCDVCGMLSILGVLANGSYALCGIGQTVPELIFGHAGRERLIEVWENNRILLKLRKGLPGRLEGICRQCLLKGRCLGSCIAQNYYRSKNLWAPFWFCEQASRQGLFPKTRLQPKKGGLR